MDNLGRRIYNARMSLGLSLEAVGQYVGVGKSTVRKWENGIIKNMRRDKIKKLSEILHVSPGYLMGWTDDPSDYGESQHISVEKKSTPVSESGHTENIVKIAGRNGSFVEKRLSDKELQALMAFVDLLPDASDDL